MLLQYFRGKERVLGADCRVPRNGSVHIRTHAAWEAYKFPRNSVGRVTDP